MRAPNNNESQSALDAIAAEIIEQQICPELAATATQLVMGSGNVHADIVFVGEAPGRQEDNRGVPFVGAAGKFLDVMLAEAGMSRDDVYITNIVKYRPPNNRDPLPAEKAAFWPFLLRQLDIIQPRVVVTLGRHAGMSFIPDLQIGRDHGRPRRVTLHGRKLLVVPLYHPAAALYNGGLRQTLIDDVVRLPSLIAQFDAEGVAAVR